jgi:hypothetical protein
MPKELLCSTCAPTCPKKVGRLVDWSGGFWKRRYSGVAQSPFVPLVDSATGAWPRVRAYLRVPPSSSSWQRLIIHARSNRAGGGTNESVRDVPRARR